MCVCVSNLNECMCVCASMCARACWVSNPEAQNVLLHDNASALPLSYITGLYINLN